VKTSKRLQRFVDDQLLDVPIDGDALSEGLLDSLAIEQLIAFAEDTFDLRFDDDELVAENFASIETVAKLVDDKRRVHK
jgi:acyl carrier protein